MVVQDAAGADAFAEIHDLLFENQPAEGTAGPDDDELVDVAVAGRRRRVGRRGSGSSQAGSTSGSRTRPTRCRQDGVNGTPTVLVDGEPVARTVPAAARGWR